MARGEIGGGRDLVKIAAVKIQAELGIARGSMVGWQAGDVPLLAAETGAERGEGGGRDPLRPQLVGFAIAAR